MERLNTTHYGTLLTPIGDLGFLYTPTHLLKIDFAPEHSKAADFNDPFWQRIVHEVHAYFLDPTHLIDLPYNTQDATPFCNSVWTEMKKIPMGQTRTYGELAEKVKTSPRAIGNACRHNRLPLLIPCHRVLAKAGQGGFFGARTGHWLNIKAWLLKHEGVIS